jgi:processive 1,2-diacylglycerol beta-glucosyltransferase
VTAGAGHLAAAAALEEAWRTARPRDLVENLDLLAFASVFQKKLFSDAYVKVASKVPELWGLVFDKTDDPKVVRGLTRLRRLLPSRSRHRLSRLVRQTRPDVVLCTHPLPLETLGNLKEESVSPALDVPSTRSRASRFSHAKPFVVSVVTDFEAHAFWMEPRVDLYCVAADETKARLVARGARANDVVSTGIPISAKFSIRASARTVRKEWGLRNDLPVVLVLSGGFGMGPVGKILVELDKAQTRFQVLVVCGRNERLRRELSARDSGRPTQVVGFTTEMHKLMEVSDLIVSKSGGLTASEALASGTPLLILNPIPGQETANSDFLLEHGAAAKVNRIEDLPYRVEHLLGSKKLIEMTRSARALGRPDAAKAVCREVLSRLE